MEECGGISRTTSSCQTLCPAAHRYRTTRDISLKFESYVCECVSEQRTTHNAQSAGATLRWDHRVGLALTATIKLQYALHKTHFLYPIWLLAFPLPNPQNVLPDTDKRRPRRWPTCRPPCLCPRRPTGRPTRPSLWTQTYWARCDRAPNRSRWLRPNCSMPFCARLWLVLLRDLLSLSGRIVGLGCRVAFDWTKRGEHTEKTQLVGGIIKENRKDRKDWAGTEKCSLARNTETRHTRRRIDRTAKTQLKLN